jgi:hypothetical protein
VQGKARQGFCHLEAWPEKMENAKQGEFVWMSEKMCL